MPRFAANLDFLFAERPFEARFEAAARAGFAGVELLFPHATPAARVASLARDAGLTLVQVNLPPGDWAAGERGLAALPGREADFRASLDAGLDYAARCGVAQVHCLAGATGDADPAACAATYRANLALAAERAAALGIAVQIEPINPRDVPGYFLTRGDAALAVLAAVGAPNLRLQLDLYHRQIVEGDLIRFLERALPQIGHVQIAGAPDRDEPDRGEIAYPAVLARLDALGYAGWVGCEYRPRAGTLAGLGWMRAYAGAPADVDPGGSMA